MSSSPRHDQFTRLFQAATEKYRAGHQKAAGLVEPSSLSVLEEMGQTEQEFFDFVEDFAKGGEPTMDTAFAIAEVRREYFDQEQKGRRSGHVIDMAALPSKDAEIDGIGWLPRLLPKAEAKLKGEMPTDLMYDCGGDRKFFRTHGIDPAEFLRQVWKAQGNHDLVVAWVKKTRLSPAA